MEKAFYSNTTFEKEIHTKTRINHKEFEECVFKNCDFTETDLSNNSFMDCEFIDCNLSMIQVVCTSFKTVLFKNCKLLGIHFNTCNDFLFMVEFQDSVLDYSSFAKKKMPKTIFKSCSLKEVSFVATHLTQSVFENCNLENTIFNDTQLNAVDFRTAYHYKIDPEYNPMKKARFSAEGIIGLLDKYDIKVG